jgi:hypothetical protein
MVEREVARSTKPGKGELAKKVLGDDEMEIGLYYI